jgi:hypothetical protein
MTDNSLARPRSVFRTLLNPAVVLFICGSVFLIYFRSFAIEPFDFDEALFRRMAEETKAAGEWLAQPKFNGEILNYASPAFIGFVAFLSALIDGPSEPTSSFSARLSGLIFAGMTAFFLHRTWSDLVRRRIATTYEEMRLFRGGISPVYFLLLGLFPVLAATAVGPDLMHSFFNTIFICTEALRIRNRNESRRNSVGLPLISAAALSGAMAVAGISGFILPLMTSILFCVFQKGSMRERLIAWMCFFPQFLFSGLLAAGFFRVLSPLESAFLINLFLDGFSPERPLMSSSVLFRLPLIIAGCSMFLAWWATLGASVGLHPSAKALNGAISQDGLTPVRLFLRTAVAVYFLHFLFFGRGLLNGAWSFVPAGALLVSLGGFSESTPLHVRFAGYFAFFAKVLPFLLPVLLFAAAAILSLWEPVLSGVIQLSAPTESVLASFLKDDLQIIFGLSGAGLLLLAAAGIASLWTRRLLLRGNRGQIFSFGIVRWLAALQTAAGVMIVLFVAPVAEHVLTTAVQQSTAKARMFLRVGGRLSVFSFYSPNLVSSNRTPVVFDHGVPQKVFADPDITVVLTPVWNTDVCRNYGFDIAQAVEYLRVCLRSYKQTLEGRQP